MEWLEVTGKTIVQAEEAALDQLGVDRSEAEFAVVDEPKSALLGLRRTEARIRARVRPVLPREKQNRNRRNTNSRNKNRSAKQGRGSSKNGGARDGRSGQNKNKNQGSQSRGDNRSPQDQRQEKPQNVGRSTTEVGKDRAPKGQRMKESKPMEDQMSMEEQSTLVTEFLDGLLDAFELDAEVYTERIDGETTEMRVENAPGVGLLIGPKGNTLRAVEDLSRMLVQRKSDGNCEGRIRVDIGGYRERRRAALESFCQKIATEVRDTGVNQPLEPMNAADRKVVHDVVAEIDGVNTVSEGQEPRRWVVIVSD